MADVLLLTEFCFSVLVQKTFLLGHAQLSSRIFKGYPHETSISPWTERLYLPNLFSLTSHDTPFLKGQKSLGERVVYVHSYDFVTILQLRGVRFVLRLELDKLPNVVLGDVIAGVGAAGYLVVEFAVGMFYFMSMQVIFGFEVAEYDWISEDVLLPIRIDLVKRAVQHLEFLAVHFGKGTEYDLASLCCNAGYGVMEFLPEGRVYIGGKAGLIYTFLFVDDGGGLVVLMAFVALPSALLVGIPLLLLRVAKTHFYYQVITENDNQMHRILSIYWVVAYPYPPNRQYFVLGV